jgi:hypothetical protein
MFASVSSSTSHADEMDDLGQHNKARVLKHLWAVSHSQAFVSGIQVQRSRSRFQDDKMSMVLPQSGASRGGPVYLDKRVSHIIITRWDWSLLTA